MGIVDVVGFLSCQVHAFAEGFVVVCDERVLDLCGGSGVLVSWVGVIYTHSRAEEVIPNSYKCGPSRMDIA